MRVNEPKFELGAWNAICDRCGFEYKNRRLKKEWTGLIVCYGPGTNQCWEPRHPQDYVRGVPDDQSTPWSRPDPPVNEPFANDGGTDVDPATDL